MKKNQKKIDKNLLRVYGIPYVLQVIILNNREAQLWVFNKFITNWWIKNNVY